LCWPAYEGAEDTTVKTRETAHFPYAVGGSAMMREVAETGAGIPAGGAYELPCVLL
jgi:hypothetical protein